MKAISSALVDHGKLVLVFILALVMLAGFYAAFNVRINSDLSTLIKPSEALSWYQDNEYFKRAFPMFEQTALVVVSGKSYQAVIRTAGRLQKQIASDASFQEVFAPGVSDFVQDRRWYFLDQDQLEDWLQGVEYSYGPMLRLSDEASLSNLIFTLADHLSSNRGQVLPPPLQTLVESLLQDEVLMSVTPLLIDPETERHYELIVIRGTQNLDRELPNAEIVAQLQEHLQRFDAAPGVEIRLTGEVVLAHEEISAALNGIEIAGLVSIILLAVILGFGIRSVGFVAAIFALLGAGVIITLGLAVLLVGSFNTLSLIFLVMFFGLGVDFAVHFGLRLTEAAEDQDFKSALYETYQDIGPALLLCMVTSSIAFLSFLPTAYKGLAELGLISAMGMVVAFVLTLSLLPLLLSRVNRKTMPAVPGISLEGHENRILSAFVLLVLGALYFAKDMQFDYSVLAMRDSSTEGMQTLLDLQDQGIATDYSISVLANDSETQELIAELESRSVVGNVLGPEQLLPTNQAEKFDAVQPLLERYLELESVNAAETGDMLPASLEYLNEVRALAPPEVVVLLQQLEEKLAVLTSDEIAHIDRELSAEVSHALSDVKRSFASPPFETSDLPPSLYERMYSKKGEHLLRVQPSIDLANRDATSRFIQQIDEVAPNIAGRSVVEWGIGDVVVESFVQASLTALLGISVVLLIFFRNLLLSVLVLIPIVVSLVLTFAICQLAGLSLNMANILVVPLIIGLGVDTGIHVVHRMKDLGGTHFASSSTGRAVLISALTTIGTFFSLSFSPHLGAASIGLLLTVAISLLVVVTFVLLPALVKALGVNLK